MSLLLLTFVGESLAAYATNTNALYNSLDTCYNDVSSDIECVENVRDGLQKMSDYIQDVSCHMRNLYFFTSDINMQGSCCNWNHRHTCHADLHHNCV